MNVKIVNQMKSEADVYCITDRLILVLLYHVYTDLVQLGGTVYCWPHLRCKVLTEGGLGVIQE